MSQAATLGGSPMIDPLLDGDQSPAAGIAPAAFHSDRVRGWVSVGADGIVRGWAVDDDDPERDVELNILVDDQVVGSTVADQLRAELPDSERMHGFNFVVPREFQDGHKHRIRAAVAGSERELKCKRPEFSVAAESVPLLAIQSVLQSEISGLVSGRGIIWPTLNLFLDGDDRPVAVEPRWAKDHSENLRFTLQAPADAVADWLKRDGALAYSGQDRSYAFPLWRLCRLDWRLEGAEVRLTLHNLPSVADLNLVATVSDPARPDTAPKDLIASKLPKPGINAFRFIVPPELRKSAFIVEAFVETDRGTRIALGSWATSDQDSSRIENGAFETWDGALPRHWTVSGAKVERGVRFDKSAPLASNLHRTVVLVSEDAARPIALSQGVRANPAATHWRVALVARSNNPAATEIRLYGESDTLLASFAARTDTKWKRFDFELVLGEDSEAPAGVLINIDPSRSKEGLVVELDAIDVTANGYEPFADHGAKEGELKDGINLVRNAGLEQWPHGLPRPTVGRYEAAAGWTVTNPGARAPTTVLAARLGPQDAASAESAYAFALQAPEITRYCRIEIALDTFPGATVGGLNLSFSGQASPLGAWPVSELVNPAKWSYINRIFVLHRSAEAGEKVICTFRKNVLLSADRREYDFFGSLNASADAVDFDSIGPDSAALFLCFEFTNALTVTLDSVRLEAGSAPKTVSPSQRVLRFEDESFEGQLRQAKTCEHWLDGNVSVPRFAEAAQDGAPATWDWKWTKSGTVEIVICVYNALEETLGCLRSLIGTTEVPHTVAIINDGSEENCRLALERFVADKPWMRVISNPSNYGYTRSADMGIRQAASDLVVLLNSDTVVHRGWLEGLLTCMASDPMIGFVGPLSNAATYQSVPETYDLAGKWAINQIPQGMTSAEIAALVSDISLAEYPRAPLLNGFCTLMKRSVYLEIEGLDIQSFPMGYGEENDLCLRVRRAGYDLAIADNVYVFHHKSASFGSERRKELSKVGDTKLKEKHADVNFVESGRRFLEIPALARMRRELRERLAERKPGGSK